MIGWLFLLILGGTWYVVTDLGGLLDPFLFPGPLEVVGILSSDYSFLLLSLVSSFKLLFTGFLLALVLAVPLGLLVGHNDKINSWIRPFTSLASPIPPIVYIPYAIALLPTFWWASSFIIFIGAFWPIFLNTANGVKQIDHRLLDSAHVLGVSKFDFYFKVLLPGAMPGIFSGISVSLILSFILLTAAEIVGGNSGLGWYVKNYSDFGDYSRVITGILFIGIVVAFLTKFLQSTEHYVLRWRQR